VQGTQKLLHDDVRPIKSTLPEDVRKHLMRVARSFQEDVIKYQRGVAHSEKLEREIKAMLVVDNEGTTRRHYPPGSRPFRCSSVQAEMDSVVKYCATQDDVFTVKLEKGISRRDACERIHHEWSMFTKKCLQEAAVEHVEVLRPRISHSHYIALCNAWQPTLPGGGQVDGLDNPRYRSTIDGVQARELAEMNYTRIVDRIRSDREKQVREQAEVAKREAEAREEVLKSSPSNLLVSLIDSRIRARGVGAQNGDDDEEQSAESDPVAKAQAFVQVLHPKKKQQGKQKNGSSPAAGPGGTKTGNVQVSSTVRPAPKAKAKAKPRAMNGGKGAGLLAAMRAARGGGGGQASGKGSPAATGHRRWSTETVTQSVRSPDASAGWNPRAALEGWGQRRWSGWRGAKSAWKPGGRR